MKAVPNAAATTCRWSLFHCEIALIEWPVCGSLARGMSGRIGGGGRQERTVTGRLKGGHGATCGNGAASGSGVGGGCRLVADVKAMGDHRPTGNNGVASYGGSGYKAVAEGRAGVYGLASLACLSDTRWDPTQLATPMINDGRLIGLRSLQPAVAVGDVTHVTIIEVVLNDGNVVDQAVDYHTLQIHVIHGQLSRDCVTRSSQAVASEATGPRPSEPSEPSNSAARPSDIVPKPGAPACDSITGGRSAQSREQQRRCGKMRSSSAGVVKMAAQAVATRQGAARAPSRSVIVLRAMAKRRLATRSG
ncbi:unnamed protein product [Lampetra fluviatilis]